MPKILPAVSLIWAPAPAMRPAMSRICFSVEAPLFPRATRADANCSALIFGWPRAFANCAIPVAASSAERFVVAPSFTIVCVKARISVRPIPSWPAASATLLISLTDKGIVLARFLKPCSSSLNCPSVASTVFRTPANDDSKLIAAFAATAASPARGSVSPCVNLDPMFSRSRPCRWSVRPNPAKLFSKSAMSAEMRTTRLAIATSPVSFRAVRRHSECAESSVPARTQPAGE
jgi:hypothetical protein